VTPQSSLIALVRFFFETFFLKLRTDFMVFRHFLTFAGVAAFAGAVDPPASSAAAIAPATRVLPADPLTLPLITPESYRRSAVFTQFAEFREKPGRLADGTRVRPLLLCLCR